MKDPPDTIKNPQAFKNSLPAGFDGVFDWSWTQGCFGETKIAPSDIDGIVERKGQFLVFETKNPGQGIPIGQKITLDALRKIGNITIMLIWGKREPETFTVWFPGSNKEESGKGIEEARALVMRWYKWADGM